MNSIFYKSADLPLGMGILIRYFHFLFFDLMIVNTVNILLHRVVAVDLRGYGDSDKPSHISAYTLEKLIKDVKQTITALGIKS